MSSEETLRPRRSRFPAGPASRPGIAFAFLLFALAPPGCGEGAPPAEQRAAPAPHAGSPPHAGPAPPADSAFVDVLQERTFRYFADLSHPVTGLTPDRAPTESFASIAATGFALTAYPIGVENGWMTRADAARRSLDTIEFLWNAPQDSSASGSTGYRGFFYHFLDPETGHRFETVELSTVDTALLIAGALFCRAYFDGDSAEEIRIRALADSLYRRVDWQWASVRPPAIGHGWNPESGFLPYDWRGYNEAMLLYLLALGSPTHPVEPAAWEAWTSGYRWGELHGQEHLGFAPLFGHQYSHVWVDFRGIRDDFMRGRGIDYFENSRRAVLAQRAYAVENPGGWKGYGPDLWGLTACDGPVDGTFEIDGRTRSFRTYAARGASFTRVEDDGTVCPSAAAASIAFAPEIVLPLLEAMRRDWGDHLFGRYGFLDALNPTFQLDVPVQHGRVVPGVGWFDTDWLGIDQGPIVAMIENRKSGLVWKAMRRDEHLVRGLRAAGFTGGWLDSAGTEP
jgi:hypothetical protein